MEDNLKTNFTKRAYVGGDGRGSGADAARSPRARHPTRWVCTSHRRRARFRRPGPTGDGGGGHVHGGHPAAARTE